MVIKMKGTGHAHFGGRSNGQKGQNARSLGEDNGVFLENGWEASEELSPDPYAEEEHTQIHSSRFSSAHHQNPNSKNA